MLLGSCSGDPEPLSGVLITLDTTRQDALGCYGARAGLTPALDTLAKESVVFDAARAVTPLTTPSHASMLTGLYPPRHTVRDNHLMRLPESADTLAERASDAGLQTGAFVAAVVLDESFGLAQGFATYDQPTRDANDPRANFAERTAPVVVDEAISWLRRLERERPFFLWVHLFDPHAPHEAAPEHLARAAGNRYLAEVARLDDEIGRLLAELTVSGRLDRTLVAVVGDHGEGLGDHGEATHGCFVYDATLKVPFLLRDPGGYGAGTRVATPVSVADVFPTFVEALGLVPNSDVDGISLFRRAPDAGRGVYFESYYGFIKFGWEPIVGWVDAGGKVVHAGRTFLYEPHLDARETRELTAAAGSEDELTSRLAPYRSAIQEVHDATPLDRERVAGADAELLESLGALGYVAAGDSLPSLPTPFEVDEGPERPSPYDRIDVLNRFLKATDLGLHGHYAEAVEGLAAIVAEDPGNASASDYLGFFLMQEGRHAEAKELFERLVAGGTARANTIYNLGVCYEKLGEEGRALEHYQRALSLDPGHVGAQRDVARLGG